MVAISSEESCKEARDRILTRPTRRGKIIERDFIARNDLSLCDLCLLMDAQRAKN